MEAVPFDTVKDQFKYNTVLADALSDQVTEPRTEGVSTVLEQYFDDVMTMAQSAGKGSSVETAFKKVIGDINMDLAPVSWLKRNEILQHDKVHLAEHHIYGSSRLGMQKYLPDELMFEDTVNASPFTYQSLTKLKPWYSMYGNDLFDTTLHRDSLVKGTISTKGMGVNTHILGNRHYELTNHLGNVQATVLDRTTPVIIDTVLIGYNADISTAQDYYPFGMYMPGRYISDTARHCVTTNTTVMVARPVRVTTAKGKLPAQSMQFGGDPEPPAVGSLPKASAFDDEAPFVFHYNPAEAHPDTWVVNTIPDDETIQYIIDFSDEPSGIGSFLQIHADTNQEVQPVNFGLELLDESMQAKARIRQYFEPDGEEYDATTWEDLTTGDQELFFEVDKASVAAGGLTLLEVVFTSNEPYFALNSKAIMHTPFTLKTSLVPTNVVTTICDDDDDYRFGFNGQEKVNEVAGIGNHNTALFWEYDTRLGRRWNLDPVVDPSVSPYSTFKGNPTVYSDLNGDCVGKDCESMTANGTKYSQKDKSKIAELEDGVVTAKRTAPASSTAPVSDEMNSTGGLFGGSGSMNLMEAADKDVGRNDQGREKVEMINKGIGISMAITAAPLAIISGGAAGLGPLFGASTELAATKALLSAGSQGLINGWSEIDIADVAGDAFTAPGLNALWSGGVDLKPFAERNQFRLQGIYNSKSAGQFGIDAAIGFGFSKLGDAAWKPLNSLLTAPTKRSIFERSFFFISTQSWISTGQQGAGKAISEGQQKE